MVGDAGCHKDPYLALGICDAFRDAEFLVDAIDDGLAGRRSLDEALAEPSGGATKLRWSTFKRISI